MTGADEVATWRDAVDHANIPTLLMLIVQMTGDRRWLDEPYRPTRARGLDDHDDGGLAPVVQEEIREAAVDAICRWRDGRPMAINVPDEELLIEMMSVSVGETVPVEYGPMLVQELRKALEGTSAPLETQPPPDPRLDVIIVGAGVSGLCAAYRLGQAGFRYTVLERHETVGGTWLHNRYPGCGVDTPSHLYSFSFARHDWSQYFALRDEIHEYLERVASEFDIRPHIRFGMQVEGAIYDEAAQRWSVRVVAPGGRIETLTAAILITAVGAFNKPKVPSISGQERFQGPAFHSVEWPTGGVELENKSVAVVGTGASAMQIATAIADSVGVLRIFQRTPQWVAPFEKFHQMVPVSVRRLLSDVPVYQAWYRLRLAWNFNDKILPTLQKDPAWPHPDRSVNAINDGHRVYFTRYIESELGERQDLLPQVVPTYPPFGKRILMDNGWYRTLTKPNVQLISEDIDRLEANAIVTQDGAVHPVDVIVWATGFDVVRFVAPLEVTGREGRRLDEFWEGDDARGDLGTMVPGFPNFFCLYGPNTQFGHGGSFLALAERQMEHLMDLLIPMSQREIGAIEVPAEVYDRYNESVDDAHSRMIWTHPGMDTYYRNSRGRVVVNNPFRVVDYWEMTRSPSLDDYVIEPRLVSCDHWT